MVLISCTQRLVLSLVVLLLLAPLAPAAEKAARYSNEEFGFSFQYPASWKFAHTDVRNMRVKIAAPEFGPAAECSVIVKQYPHAVKAKQSEIDAIFQEPPTVAELKEVLSQGGDKVTVTKATTGKLDTRPTHVARYHLPLGFDQALSGQVAITATPGLTWSVSCSGRGENVEVAEKNYQHWQKSIEAVMASFRFSK